ncbi:MAG: lipopolysaccharide transport periplasmic protein LptA [Pseudoxanthomonas suwonensis]|nr:lipopolysaccharide transport periplasmic protein LptA [Pseudoxanthomonas suwonensis]
MSRPAESTRNHARLPLAGILLGLALLAGLSLPAEARRSDRNQQMVIDADTGDYATDGSRPSVLRGNVTIVQGTLNIRADRADIHQTGGGDIARVVLHGSPATLRQQMDDGTPMNVRAAQIDYNHQSEIAVFTGNVRVEQPRGSLSGERVTYNMVTGQVQSGGEGSGRVRMTIQPRATQQGGN